MAGCTIAVVSLFAWATLSVVNNIIKTEADSNLVWMTRYYTKGFSLDFITMEDKMQEIEVLIKSTIDIKALRERRDAYLQEYEQQITPYIQQFADQRTLGLACWVYFDPKWSDKPHDIYFVDGDNDGKAERQAHIPLEYYDNTPTTTDDKEWWYGPLRTQKGFWTNPYEWTVRNGDVIKVASYALPIFIDGEFVGVVGTYYRFSKLAKDIGDIKVYETGFASLFNEKLDVVLHPSFFSGTRNTSDNLATVRDGSFSQLASYVRSRDYGIARYSMDGEERLFAFSKLSNGWVLAVNPPVSEVYAAFYTLVETIALGVALCLLVASFAAYLMARSITRPLRKVVKSAEVLSAGDFDEVVEVDTNDEIKTLAIALGNMTAHIRQMTHKLRQSYERMQTLVEGAGMFTWDYDVKAQTMAHNAHFIRAVHYPGPAQDGVIPTQWLRERIHPNDLPALESLRGRIPKGTSVNFESRLLISEGEWRWFKNMGRVEECDEDGFVLRVAGTGFDIHSQKLAEFSEAEHKQQLEELVAQRTRELLESRNQAEAASQAKTAFLSTVSHEIRTPMNAILGFSHMFNRDNLAPTQLEYLDKIRISASALLNIINDVLDISKIESGKLELENAPFNIHTLLDTVISIVGFAAREKNLALATSIEPDMPENFSGDAKRISQVLLNLLNNAVKFTTEGTITLTAERTKGAATPEGTTSLTMCVADTGIGLTPEQMDRLFKPFSQADNSITRKYGGTGLGLAICKQLVGVMGGEISVTSTLGHGSTFRVTLLLERVEESHLDTAQALISQAGDGTLNHQPLFGKLALVAEDNTINQEIARAFLESAGLIVDMADNGHLAVEMAKTCRYDIIFMDMQMPVMDGLEATRRIRSAGAEANSSTPWLADVPIVAMTANAMFEDRARCLEAGMNDHISKPIDPVVLQRSLLHWVSGIES